MKYAATILSILLLASLGCDRPDFGTRAKTGDVIDTDVDREDPSSPTFEGEDNSANNVQGEPVVGEANNTASPPEGGPQPSQDFDAVVDASAKLGFAAYHDLAAEGSGPIVVGSYGLTRSASVASLGASGTARADLEAAASDSLFGIDLHNAFNALDLDLTQRDSFSRVDLVTAAWVPQATEVEQLFVDDLARYYGLSVRRAEFATRPEDARIAINNFYRTSTGGELTDVVPVRTVDNTTELLVTDGNVFRGTFEDAFDPAYTEPAEFTGSEGVRTVQMMRREGTVLGMSRDGFRAIELPFDGGFSALLVLPDEGRFAEIEAQFTPEFVEGILSDLVPSYLVIGLPRATLTGRVDAYERRTALGLENVFASDFSSVYPDARLSNIVQRTRLAFVEDGISADPVDLAPLTEDEARSADVPSLFFSQSFLFVIRDQQTNTVLFLGRLD